MRKLLLSFWILLLLAPAGRAGSVVSSAEKAEEYLINGDPIAAYQEVERTLSRLWTNLPLTFQNIKFVTEITGYGIYTERAEAVFKPDEPLLIYLEALGYGYGSDASGNKSIAFDIDFALTNEDGSKILFQKENFLKLGIPVRHENREFYMRLKVSLSGIPEGNFKGRFFVKDKNSDKSQQFEMAFQVR